MTTTAAKQPSRRRQPAANPALSREEIARVGLELGRTEGFEQLSMRSLARVLGVTPMALYHHVKDKKDLNALIVDSVLTKVKVPDADFGDWKERLAELTRQHYDERTRYPGFDALIYETRITPQGTRLMESYIQVLLDGGFSQREAVFGLSVLYTQGFGASLLDRQLAGGAQRTGKGSSKTISVSVASHWRQLSDSEKSEFFRAIRHDILVAGLESFRGTMPDEE
jgi:AcrR family transcriptional regulator